MDTHHTSTLIGPFATQEQAEAAADAAMASMHLQRDTVLVGAALGRELRHVCVFRLGGRHWLELGDDDPPVVRLLAVDPQPSAYRCHIENRFDDESHGGELSQLTLQGMPPRLVAVREESFEEEDLVRGGVLPEVGLYYLIEFIADAHDFARPHGSAPDPTTTLHYRPQPILGSAMVVRARRALMGAVDWRVERVDAKWELRIHAGDGSRRILRLSQAEWDELGLTH
jgi:hypothetical protein